ncbi:MATE family efflux transporter [Turicibacter sanguinis]|jgi:MATE efflux family protein|uniref:MATE family efflux transporter n=1 Tax=Turicibacter sanguinis TaxID=154288 RepID=UPI00104DE8A8|nr:MATE family efflux transporter [Turicibacter sanguinis]MCU7212891.1 MATE family efflux transporter [Turicibacter sanguinis]MDB8543048.1 MATE family efflux transporter [Turicibacter sanguinis]MDB8545689.1 MATE family efflux transporter [Turicibacter sanguinis]MDB8553757.1 MATE family efflux transporter [Turicibacter sanguinis]MDB8559564.1 MATE family efflux transporter [Turicibacter sanguinis]
MSFEKKSLFQLSWPIFIELTLFMLMGMVDTFMLSAYSDNAVAAVGMSNQVINLIGVMFNFVAAGTIILVSQNLGAKNQTKACEVSIVSIGANFLIGIILSVVMITCSKYILTFMNTPLEIMDITLNYTKIIGSFLFLMAIQPVLSGILRSFGYTKHSMIITLIANLINICGNALFIYGLFGVPELGPVGVAISTVFSRFVTVVLIAVIIYRKIEFKFSTHFFKSWPLQDVKNILKIGVPSALEQLAYSTSQVIIISFVSMLGTLAITTRVYTGNISMFVYLFSLAIAQGNQVLVGYLIGEKKTDEVSHQTFKTQRLAVSVSLGLSIICYLGSDFLFGIFTSDANILSLGHTLLLINVFLEIGRATNLVLTNALKAAGDINYPFILGIVGMWVICIPVAYVLGIWFGLGLAGIWIAFAVDECFRGLVFTIRWKSQKWVNKSFIS